MKRQINDLFEATIGVPPATFRGSQLGVSAASGIEAQTAFQLQAQPGRVDLIMVPAPIDPSAIFPVEFPELRGALAQLAQRFEAGSTAIGDVSRIALIVTTAQGAASPAQAARVASEVVGLRLPFADASDFVFQINRRRELKCVPGYEINRVLKWSSATLQQVEITAGVGVGAQQSAEMTLLSVDVNTVPTLRAFPPAEQVLIFGEIRNEAERLAEENSINSLR